MLELQEAPLIEEDPFYHLTDEDKTAIAARIKTVCKESLKPLARIMLDAVYFYQKTPKEPTRLTVVKIIQQKLGQAVSSLNNANIQYLAVLLGKAAGKAGKPLALRCFREHNQGKGHYRFCVSQESPQQPTDVR